jgi:hypothetical protein
VGRGGRIFVTVAFMAQNEGSPVYRCELLMITKKDDPAAAPFHAYDVTKLETNELLAELREADWSRRDAAHQEILRRDDPTRRAAMLHWLHTSDDTARADENYAWLAGATGDAEALAKLKAVAGLAITAPAVRLQAIRAFTEFGGASQKIFLDALQDRDPQIQFAGVIGLFDFPGKLPKELLAGSARSTDTYLRQAAATLIAKKSSLAELQELCKSSDAATRLAGTLAVGFRLTMPPSVGKLPAELKLDPYREEAAYVVHYADATIDLRKLGPMGQYTMADRWKQTQHSLEQEALFAQLQSQLTDPAAPVRLQAAFFLSLLNDPRSEPEVA